MLLPSQDVLENRRSCRKPSRLRLSLIATKRSLDGDRCLGYKWAVALSPDVLSEIANLVGPLAEVRQAVELVVAAQQPDADPLTKEDALSSVERATGIWLDASGSVESALLRYLPSGEPGLTGDRSEDETDAVERLGGLSFIHLAVASDLAKLAPIDALDDDDPVSAAGLSPTLLRHSAIQAVTGDGPDEGQVLRAMTLPTQQADAEDDDAEDDDAEDKASKGSRRRVYPDDVLKKLVDRAGVGVRSVLVGVAPSPHVVFLAVKPVLEPALNLTPDVVMQAAETAARSIRRLVKLVIRSVYDEISKVTQGHLEVVRELLEIAQPQELILARAVRYIVAKVLKEKEIKEIIQKTRFDPKQGFLKRKAKKLPWVSAPDNTAKLRKILKSNKRWVGRPIPVLARFLHPLWAVPIGPVPAAPIAASLLLTWTILFTGDQLDAPGPFPNFWRPGLINLI
jgi:hypothetical protein